MFAVPRRAVSVAHITISRPVTLSSCSPLVWQCFCPRLRGSARAARSIVTLQVPVTVVAGNAISLAPMTAPATFVLALRGWSMPLTNDALEMSDEPCSARRRPIARAAHVRPRRAGPPEFGCTAALHAPRSSHARARTERARLNAHSLSTRGRDCHNTVLGGHRATPTP